jgi:hypothetical protein
VRGDRPAHGQVASLRESGQASLYGPAFDQDVPAALAAAQPDVRSEPVDQPFQAAAGMGAPQADDVAEAELHDTRLVRGHYDNLK